MSFDRRFAIIVGSNCYIEKRKRLEFTIKDVQDMSNILQKRCGFHAEDIIIVEVDIRFKENIEGVILRAFNDISKKIFDKNMSSFLFYYSGHGSYKEEDSKSYLELSDHEQISVQEIFNEIAKLKIKNSYLIIDACNAGGQIDFNQPTKGKLARQLKYNSKGTYCLLGSTSALSSYEPSKSQTYKYHIKNGFLTHFLIEGIEKKERYTNGILGFGTLQEYVTIKTQIISGFEQIPVTQTVNTEGTHPFGIWEDLTEIEDIEQEFSKNTKAFDVVNNLPLIIEKLKNQNENTLLINELHGKYKSIQTWFDKKHYYEENEAFVFDIEQKYSNKKKIEECDIKINKYEEEINLLLSKINTNHG